MNHVPNFQKHIQKQSLVRAIQFKPNPLVVVNTND